MGGAPVETAGAFLAPGTAGRYCRSLRLIRLSCVTPRIAAGELHELRHKRLLDNLRRLGSEDQTESTAAGTMSSPAFTPALLDGDG